MVSLNSLARPTVALSGAFIAGARDGAKRICVHPIIVLYGYDATTQETLERGGKTGPPAASLHRPGHAYITIITSSPDLLPREFATNVLLLLLLLLTTHTGTKQ